MGQTRLNAYLGLAAPYIIRDPAHPIDKLLPTTSATGVVTPGTLSSAYELPLVIQDRDFTDVSTTPGKNEQYYEEAPAGPERYGSVWMVNGATTPFVNVTDHVYRLRLLNGSQARVATLKWHIELGNKATNTQTVNWKPAMYVIGHEQGADPTLTPAVKSITIAPGERLDLLVDFRLAGKQLPVNGTFKFLLINTAPAPFPGGVACIAPGLTGGPIAGTKVNSTGQPLAVQPSGLTQPNNCIPQPVWAWNPANGQPAINLPPPGINATPISQVMEFRLTRDTIPGATAGTVVNAPATALDTWTPVADAPVTAATAKKIDPNAKTLLAQTLAKYCVGVPAGTVCDYKYLIARGKLKERIFTLYDLPFANLVLGPMGLNPTDLRFGVNIDNLHYTDPGSVNAGLPGELVQNTMQTPVVDALGNPITTDIVEEVWTYVNATPDAHPMHEHLFAMQALDREYFDSLNFLNDSLGYPLLAGPGNFIPAPSANLDPLGLPYPYHHPLANVPGVAPGNPSQNGWAGYVGDVNNGVPGTGAFDFRNYVAKTAAGVPCGSYGNTVPATTAGCIAASTAAANNLTGAIVTSSNPLTPQAPAPLAPEDRNWKDVIVSMPGQITRVLVRTARPDGTSFSKMPAPFFVDPVTKTLITPTNTALLFNNTVGTFPMHCHILEHEENDMMTSFAVK
jgi:FtsP/CotA-like multicopper oxidase with cupredoxin domain